MKSVDYLIEMTIRWQFLFGVTYFKNYNGWKYHAVIFDFMFFKFVVDVSRKTDELFKFTNLL